MRPLLYLLIATLFLNTANAQFVFTKLNLPTLSVANFGYTQKRWALLNGKVYFDCYTYQWGQELWETDGTPAGTKVVKDIYHDYWSGLPEATLITYNGKMFFSANDSTHGNELWYSDGTGAGTQMLIDIMVGRFTGCYFEHSTVYNGKLYFTADSNQYQGKEPWVTDGTAQGTFLLKDINPSMLQRYNGSLPRDYHQHFGLLYFIADTAHNIPTLYQTNGTPAGTVLVNTDTMPAKIRYAKAPFFNSKIYYISQGQIWTYDGTFTGMKLLKDFSGPSGFVGITTMEDAVEYKGRLYFSANDRTNGYELWTTDGTTAGTTMLKDINPGSGSSNCNSFTIHNGLLYFAAADTLGSELWVTDGTAAGTHMVADIITGNKSSSPHTFTSANNRLHFIARNNFDFEFLYYTDGTDTGTHRLEPPWAVNDSLHSLGPKLPPPMTSPSQAGYFIVDKSIYVYAKYDSTWYNLWRIEDTSTVDTSTSIRTKSSAEELSVNIYPNPAHTYLSVKTTASFRHGIVNIKDMAGRTLQTATIQQGAETKLILNNMPAATYIVDIWLDERRTTQRLVIQ